MHLPHRWGFLQFAAMTVGEGIVHFSLHPDEPVKDGLRALYELQLQYYKKHQKYALTLEELNAKEVDLDEVDFEVSATRYKISASSRVDGSRWQITEDSRIWKSN